MDVMDVMDNINRTFCFVHPVHHVHSVHKVHSPLLLQILIFVTFTIMEFHPYATWILIVFIIGYAAITLEHFIKINKATSALLMSILTWAILFQTPFCEDKSNLTCFLEQFGDISQVIFFLLGALAIVEMINSHHGFSLISQWISVSSKRKLLWLVSFIAFFLSAVLDNLTTTIVMITLLRKLMAKSEERLIIGGAIVIAANAGGAWTPIGDVTTTMLWIGEQLTPYSIMKDLFIPSVICLVVSLLVLTPMVRGNQQPLAIKSESIEPYGKTIFALGIGALIFVPIFKMLTGLPPFMGILLGVSILWIFTDYIHGSTDEKNHLKMPGVLTKIDFPSILFFLGILLCVDSLNMANILKNTAFWLDQHVGNVPLIATFIGLLSAIVDNVPLVAAAMRMYPLSQHPVDSPFWQLVAYCAGTGGSILVIGSAAGVVYMGIEKVDFFWYLKRISFAALAGYLAGIAVYLFFSTM